MSYRSRPPTPSAARQAALELQHNHLTLSSILLLPADTLTLGGRPLAASSTLRYVWGRHTYEFPRPALIPVLAGVDGASFRLDDVHFEAAVPSLAPPFSSLLDLQTLWRSARQQIRCGQLVRERFHALLLQGAEFDADVSDPWAQYRVTAAGGAAGSAPIGAPYASLPFEWMPEEQDGRDAAYQLLGRLPADSLLVTARSRTPSA